MSGTHGVFQHRTGYFYTILEEDFCELYKADGVNEVCRAYITSILENLTNKQYEATGSDKDIWVFMSIPEMARRMRHAFGERTIHKELQGMIKDGYLQKRRATGKATMEYKLNLKKLRSALDALPEKQSCISATYHLANLQDQSGKNATLTLQNSKNDLAELQPRISNRLQREEIENTESTYVAHATARTPLSERVDTRLNHPTIAATTQDMVGEAKLDMLREQQGDEHHAETSRELVEVSTGAQTSHAALGAVPRESTVPGEARISDEPKTSHDLDDVFRGNTSVFGHSGQAVRGAATERTLISSSSLPPNGDGAVGSAPQSSGPRRSGKGKDVTQALPAEAERILDEWDSLHKKPFPRTEKHIQAAALLVACHPTKDELQQCERWLYSTDRPEKPWYRKHGVRLQDIAENIGKWQSLQDAPEPTNTKAQKSKDEPGLTPEQQAHYDELKAKYPRKKAEVQA